MNYILGNVTSILLATAASLAIGVAYTRLTSSRRTGSDGHSRVALLVLAFLAEFWLASILAGALILAPAQANPWIMALASAVVIWIGFVCPTLLVTQRFRRESVVGSVLDCLHWLAAMVTQAAVLHAIGLVAPA